MLAARKRLLFVSLRLFCFVLFVYNFSVRDKSKPFFKDLSFLFFDFRPISCEICLGVKASIAILP